MIRITDVLGRTHAFARPPERVVSLVPSLTETLADLGAAPALVAVTEYCLFPEERVAALPRIGGTKNPRIDAIRALEPDLVYVNVEENLARHAEEIAAFAPVFATEPKSVAGVMQLIADLGAIHGREEDAAAWRERIAGEIALAGKSGRCFTFACPIWKDPWMWCGADTYVSDLVTVAGGVNVLAAERRYPRVEVENVAQLEPDVIFLPDEPYAFSDDDASSLRKLFGGRVVGPFPGHLFTWHGTRTAKGLAFLQEALSRPR